MNNYRFFSNTNQSTHNAYTQVGAELGLPALIVYIMFLVGPLKELRRIERETAEDRKSARFHYLAIGLEASLIGYMVSSFFASVAFLWNVYYLIGYAICLRRLYVSSLEPGPTA
jgi:O-antigen ligase